MLNKFFSWLFGLFRSKPKVLSNTFTKPVEKVPEPPVAYKPKIHILAFRKQQLVGKVFVSRTHMIHLKRFLGIKSDKFHYQVTYTKLT